MNHKNFKIKISPFNASVDFYIGEYNEFQQWLTKEFSMVPDRDCDGASAATFDVYNIRRGTICAIWVPVNAVKDMAVIAHEVIHAVGLVFKYRGIPYNLENTEVIAYMTEYIINGFIKMT